MSEEGIVLARINAIRSDHKDVVIHHLSGQSDAVAVLALFHACAQGSILVVQEMAQRHLHLFNARNKDGQTLLHVAASNGNHFIVMLLLEIKPELCVMCDNSFEIPLHLAAKNGHRDVVERLLLAYPDSLEIANFRHEMALHLALKSSESSTALYLLQEIERQKKQHLLHFKDTEGNTILHIAVTNKLVMIVEWLFSCKTYNCKSHGEMMITLMNSKNHSKLTLLDICCREPEEQDSQNMNFLLQAAAPEKQCNLVRQPYEKDNIRLTVAIGNVGVAFAILTNIPAVFHEDLVRETFSFWDLISAKLPANFYLLLFIVAMFMAGVIEVGNVIWSHPFRKSLLVTTACTWLVFYLLVDKQILRFSIWIGSSSISSSPLLWSSALSLILMMYIALKCGRIVGMLASWLNIKQHPIDLQENKDNNLPVEQYV